MPGDVFNRSPGHREVMGASLFSRRVVGMRDTEIWAAIPAWGGESARGLAAGPAPLAGMAKPSRPMVARRQ